MYKGYWIVADLDGTLTPTPGKSGGKYYSLSMSATVFGKARPYYSCLPWLRYFIARGGSVCAVSTAGRRLWWQLYNDLASVLYPYSFLPSLLLSTWSQMSSIQSSTSSLTTFAAESNNSKSSNIVNEEKMETKLTNLIANNNKNEVSVESNAKDSANKFMEPGKLLLCGFTGAALLRTRPCDQVWKETLETWKCSSDDDKFKVNTNSNSNSDSNSCCNCENYPSASIALEEWVDYRQSALDTDDNITTNNNIYMNDINTTTTTTTLSKELSDLAVYEGRAALIRFFEHVSYISHHDVSKAFDFFSSCLSTKYHSVYTQILECALNELEHNGTFDRSEMNRCNVVPHLCFNNCSVFEMSKLNEHGYYLKETNDAVIDYQRIPNVSKLVHSPELTTKTKTKTKTTDNISTTIRSELKTTTAEKEEELSKVSSENKNAEQSANIGQIVVMGIPSRYSHLIFPSLEKEHRDQSKSSNIAQSESNNIDNNSISVMKEDEERDWMCCPHCTSTKYNVIDKLHKLGLELKQQPNSICILKAHVNKSLCVRWLCKHSEELNFDLTRALAFGDAPESVDRPLTQFPAMKFISLSPHPPTEMKRNNNNNNNNNNIVASNNDINSETNALTNSNVSGKSVYDASHVYYVGGEEEGTALFLEELFGHIEQFSSIDAACANDENRNNNKNYFSAEQVACCAEKAHRRASQIREMPEGC